MKKHTIVFLLLFSWIFFVQKASAETWHEWERQTTTNQHKSWTITFNKQLKEESVHEKNIFLVDVAAEKKFYTDLILGKDGRSIIVKAPTNGYVKGEYLLAIHGVQSITEEIIEPTAFNFLVEPQVVHIKDIEEIINLPETIEIVEEGKVKEEKVDWNLDALEKVDTYTFEIKGTVYNTSKEVAVQVILDEVYFTTLLNNLLAPVTPTGDNSEGYRNAKLIEFLLKELVQNPENFLQLDALVTAHLKGTVESTVLKVMANEFLNKYVFDASVKEEKQISACLSDLIVAQMTLSSVDAGVSAQKCVENIFDYIYKTFDLDPKDVTGDTLDAIQLKTDDHPKFRDASVALKDKVDGMEGYWLAVYTKGVIDKDLYVLKENKKGEIEGTRYMIHYGEENERKVKGHRTEDKIILTSYYGEEAFNRYMKNVYGIKNAKYLGDDYYTNTSTISNDNLKTGHHTMISMDRSGNPNYNLTAESIKYIRVEKPPFKLFYNNFDYLEDLKYRY